MPPYHDSRTVARGSGGGSSGALTFACASSGAGEGDDLSGAGEGDDLAAKGHSVGVPSGWVIELFGVTVSVPDSVGDRPGSQRVADCLNNWAMLGLRDFDRQFVAGHPRGNKH